MVSSLLPYGLLDLSELPLDLSTGLFNEPFGFEFWIAGSSTRELFDGSFHLVGFALQFVLGALFHLVLLLRQPRQTRAR